MYPPRLIRRIPSGDRALAESGNARTEEDESAIIQRILGGDAGAYRVLVERHQRRVYAVILRLVRREADAEDLAQQAFISAYDALGRFDLSRKFSSWLLRIAVNLSKDHLKSKKQQEIALDEEVSEAAFAGRLPSPDGARLGQERRAHLEQALGTLSQSDREILILRDIEELTYQEIRVILSRPITALKIRVVRARARLRAALARRTDREAL